MKTAHRELFRRDSRSEKVLFEFSDGLGGMLVWGLWAELYLFPRKDVLVEVKLDLLVGNVDAELLKRVLLEVFKTKYVQDADVKALVVLSGEDKDKMLNL